VRSHDRGAALLVVLMCMTLLMGLGGGLVLLTATESRIAATFTGGVEGLYAAEAAIHRVLSDLAVQPDPNAILMGAVRSSFVDGDPSGVRTLPGGDALDLAPATNIERCGQPAPCSDAEIAEATAERPYGSNNPHWQLYAFAPIYQLLPGTEMPSRFYAVAWIGDDPFEEDDLPLSDGGSNQPGHGLLAVRARAYGPRGVRRTIEVVVATGANGPRILAWREL
jgi:hypothetical protein